MGKAFSFLFYMQTLFIFGLFTFLNGFFPIPSNNQSVEEFEKPSAIGRYNISPPIKQFTRTVLIIVDAFRNEFLSETNLPFGFKNACSKLELKVDIPTVTLPRIKSLITGTLSSFSDIVANLGSTDVLKDSLLHRIRKNGNDVIFVGDKVWVDLFHNIFKRYETNMESFFVNDFYEGDAYVTKIIRNELKNTDWDMLIAHYLGLDHIGHVEGSSSRRISTKLREMDGVIEKIVAHENSINDILFVTADHGMRDGGGHGGNTDEELHVPLITFHRNCASKISPLRGFKQIDLTPTLAMLMAVDIPARSIGCIIPDIIEYMSSEDQLYAYHYNAMHLYKKVTPKFGQEETNIADIHMWLTSAKQTHMEFLRTKRVENITSSFLFEKSKQDYIRASKEISKLLVESISFFKYDLIAAGIILSTLVTINSVLSVVFWSYVNKDPPNVKKCLLYIIMGTFIAAIGNLSGYITVNHLHGCLIVLPISASIYIFENIVKILATLLSFRRLNYTIRLPLPIATIFLFQTCSLASSSFIEEEHQIWYYFGATLLICLCTSNFLLNLRQRMFSDSRERLETSILRGFWKLRPSFVILAVIALLRKLNQTGDKWKQLQDFGDILNEKDNILWLSAFFAIGLLMLGFLLHNLTTPLQFTTAVVALSLLYCYNGVNNVVIFFYQQHSMSSSILTCIWICIGIMSVQRYKYVRFVNRSGLYKSNYGLIGLLQTNLACFLLISAMLHKPHNVILLFAMILTLKEAFRLCDCMQRRKSWKYCSLTGLTYKVAVTIVLSKMFYFYQGNSNSLATIDLNPGFIGQTTYNPFLAVFFITLNTYSSQINAFLYLFLHICINYHESTIRRNKKEVPDEFVATEITEENIKTVTLLFTAITILRTNLYLLLLVFFRHHLFIYSVFSPKALYESFNITAFYLSYSLTNLYFRIIKYLKLIVN